MKIENREDAVVAAQKIIDQQRKENNINQEQLKSWLDVFAKSEANDDDIFGTLSSLLALDDEIFGTVAPVFLDQLENDYHDPNVQALMLQMYNVRGITQEDIQVELQELFKQIDEEGFALVSPNKRDFLKHLLTIIYDTTSSAAGVGKKIIDIPIELCHPRAKMPTYAHINDAGMDLYALDDITIAPGETKLVPTGIKMAIPKGYEIQIRPKSGRCLNTKLRIANSPATIDSGYRQEIGVIIDNIDPPVRAVHPNPDGSITSIGQFEFGQSYTIGKGEKFAQIVLSEVPIAHFVKVDNVEQIPNDGRSGGFGSSGLK